MSIGLLRQQRLSSERTVIQNQILDIEEKLENINKNAEELSNRFEELNLEEVRDVEDEEKEKLEELSGEAEELEKEKEKLEEEKSKLEEKLEDIENNLEEMERNAPNITGHEEKRGGEKLEDIRIGTDEKEKRAKVNDYIRYRENPDGIDSTTAGVVIPEEIIYKPEDELKTVTDLSKYVNKIKVTGAKGSYPIRKRASKTLNTVEELVKNPKLADPEFIEVDWAVDTYRGAIAISQEAIDDSQVDLISLVAKDAGEQKLNTVNKLIGDIFKGFAPITAKSIDEIKEIINKKLDRAYERVIIASASFYHAVDVLKDDQGRYLLQPDIKSPTGYRFLGCPIEIVNDDLLGSPDEAKAFIGDSKRAVLLADRKDLEVRWTDDNIYGEYLRAGMRMGAVAADKGAGYLVSFEPETVDVP